MAARSPPTTRNYGAKSAAVTWLPLGMSLTATWRWRPRVLSNAPATTSLAPTPVNQSLPTLAACDRDSPARIIFRATSTSTSSSVTDCDADGDDDCDDDCDDEPTPEVTLEDCSRATRSSPVEDPHPAATHASITPHAADETRLTKDTRSVNQRLSAAIGLSAVRPYARFARHLPAGRATERTQRLALTSKRNDSAVNWWLLVSASPS